MAVGHLIQKPRAKKKMDESLEKQSRNSFEKKENGEKKTVSNCRSRRDLSNGPMLAS